MLPASRQRLSDRVTTTTINSPPAYRPNRLSKEAPVVRSSDGDEEIVAYIEPVPGRSIDSDALKQSLRAQLAPYKIPSRIVCMDKLPASRNA